MSQYLDRAGTQIFKHRRLKKSPNASSRTTDSTVKRKTRSNSKASSADGGVITIYSSSDEGDDTSIDASNNALNTSNDSSEVRYIFIKVQQCYLYYTDLGRHVLLQQAVAERRASLRPRRAVGDLASIDAVRIAIGKKIVKSKCALSIQFGTAEPYIQFSFEDRGNIMSEHRVHLKSGEELKEVKYHIADDTVTPEGDDIGDSMTVIAFRITPTDKNNLIKYTSSYDREESDQVTGKQYISVEVRDADEFGVRNHGRFCSYPCEKCQA
jgi:hypothetical protein